MATRPMLNVTTTVLCERIEGGDVLAAREGVLRLAHGVRPSNARKLRTVLGDALVNEIPAPVAAITPTPAPATVTIPGATPEMIAQVTAAVLAALTPASAPAVASAPVVTSTPVPAPAPVQVPNEKKKSAAAAFAKRVSALADENARVTLKIRASKLAKREGFTLESVGALSDDECLALVSNPIR